MTHFPSLKVGEIHNLTRFQKQSTSFRAQGVERATKGPELTIDQLVMSLHQNSLID